MGKYGLTVAQYDAILVSQQGRCAACSAAVRHLQIDHCHETGVVRGLLCPGCNSALGHARDDVARLLGLIDYLRGCRVGPGRPELDAEQS